MRWRRRVTSLNRLKISSKMEFTFHEIQEDVDSRSNMTGERNTQNIKNMASKFDHALLTYNSTELY